jgi:hypothetical protein
VVSAARPSFHQTLCRMAGCRNRSDTRVRHRRPVSCSDHIAIACPDHTQHTGPASIGHQDRVQDRLRVLRLRLRGRALRRRVAYPSKIVARVTLSKSVFERPPIAQSTFAVRTSCRHMFRLTTTSGGWMTQILRQADLEGRSLARSTRSGTTLSHSANAARDQLAVRSRRHANADERSKTRRRPDWAWGWGPPRSATTEPPPRFTD